MNLTGKSFIGNSRGNGDQSCGSAINPNTGESLSPETIAATAEEVQHALDLAKQAFATYRSVSGKDKADFLRAIASNIEAQIEQIVELGMLEAALPEMRMRGETGRTVGQLRLFANMVEEGSWVNATIEHAQPDRAPIPKVDLRSMNRALGPVAVFAASNFPLAFSVAGGDTASALAAGCPVIVKAHSAHPQLSELIAQCVSDAVNSSGLPEGTFSMLFGSGFDLGQKLVKAPEIKAVGFTGSVSGGRALMDIAAARPEPIPVYAEMGSINPIVISPEALGDNSSDLANAYFGSLTLGVGQFCTNPGLVLLPASGSEAFLEALQSLVSQGSFGTMLNGRICSAYKSGVDQMGGQANVSELAGASTEDFGQVGAIVFQTTASELLENHNLVEEIFGPAALIATYEDTEQLHQVLASLPGQLTATVHCPESQIADWGDTIEILTQRAGRIIINGFPTGVEVCESMVHGGPYPASSDSKTTSVGNMAIFRFARPVAYQSFPQSALPLELQDANPLGVRQKINGKYS